MTVTNLNYICNMISEEKLQSVCFQWFHNTYPSLRGLLWHVPNGGKRSLNEANKFKAIGVVSGVADLHFFYNGKIYFLELKVEGGKQSANQKAWEDAIVAQQGFYVIITSFEQFKNFINAIYILHQAI